MKAPGRDARWRAAWVPTTCPIHPSGALVLSLLTFIGWLGAADAYGQSSPGAPTPEVPCSVWVSSRGDDRHDGRHDARAVRTPDRAVRLAQPGDVVCFARGRYPRLRIYGKRGEPGRPIVFRAAPGASREATFTTGSLRDGLGAQLADVDHIVVKGLRVTRSQTGLGCHACRHVRIEGVLVESVGQAGLHVGRPIDWTGAPRFTGPPSEHVALIGNTVRDTGLVTARYGEGVYVGTGAIGGDETHDILVEGNTLLGTRAEGIEVKPFTRRVTVRGNLVMASSHAFKAAITIAVSPVDYPSGEYLVEFNRVVDFRSTGGPIAGIGIGHGDTIVRHNLVWAIAGGSGIRTYTTFVTPGARRVLIEHNTVWTPGAPSILLHEDDGRAPGATTPADVECRDNLTSDGAAGSLKVATADFLGPTDGVADAGPGPGSGLRPRAGIMGGADIDTLLRAFDEGATAP